MPRPRCYKINLTSICNKSKMKTKLLQNMYTFGLNTTPTGNIIYLHIMYV